MERPIDFVRYENGHLFWKEQTRNRRLGKPIGYRTRYGYRCVRINRRGYMAHRLVWELHHGLVPDGFELDHINNDRDDNRIENLRIVSKSTNQRSKPKIRGRSLYKGVVLDKKTGKWRASCRLPGLRIKHIGTFVTELEAAEAYNDYVLNHVDPEARVNEIER